MAELNSQQIQQTLENTFHLQTFRPLQKEIITDIINGRDLLVLMPTGGGKSLCFQLPALLMPGLTVVISPLISLIYDQILGLRELNIPSCFWNSQTTAQEKRDILNNLRAAPGQIPEEEKYKLLYTTPETLTNNFSFMDLLKDLKEKGELSRFVIDEAHCLSNWGHEFRPSYLELRVLKDQYPAVPIASFTATAVPKVQMDIIKQLNLQKPKIYRQSFIRPNITYRVKARQNNATETLEEVSEWIKNKFPSGSGIIYCLSRKKCEETAMELIGMGVSADFYHAQIEPKKKETVQKNWLAGKIQVIVATIAFALGINKADVRFVIHLAMPKSIEGYYQETGRAGRDRLPSECVLYYSIQDKIILESMIKKEAQRSRSEAPVNILTRIQDMYDYCTNLVDCRKRQLSQYLGEHIDYICNSGCDVCLEPYPTKTKSIANAVDLVLRSLIVKGSAASVDSTGFLRSLVPELPQYNRVEVKRILNHLLRYGILENKAYLTKGDRRICEVLKLGPALRSFGVSGLKSREILASLDSNVVLEMLFKNESKITDFFEVRVKPKKKSATYNSAYNRAYQAKGGNKKFSPRPYQNKKSPRSGGGFRTPYDPPGPPCPPAPQAKPFYQRGKKQSPGRSPYPDFISDPTIISLKKQFQL